MLKDVIIVPADPRHLMNKEVLITNEMKKNCMGRFSWEEDAPYYDENGDLVESTAIRTVPWDLCKEIYKIMARVASKHKC